MVKQSEVQKIVIKPLERTGIKIKVRAIKNSTYIPHQLHVDGVKGIIGREFGDSKAKKLRNEKEEYESCFYKTDKGKYGIPARAFMGAVLDASVPLGIPKTQIKRAMKIIGDTYELKYDKINKREDVTRRSGRNSSPNIAYRPEFVDWSCEIMIEFDKNQITPDQIINLVNQAGFTSGVGDWRPSAPKTPGNHGMFEVYN